jgi:hypothetical protein
VGDIASGRGAVVLSLQPASHNVANTANPPASFLRVIERP